MAAKFTEADLRDAASLPSYERGIGYLHQVEDLETDGTLITATVYGNDAYQVRLTFGEWGVQGDCTCPFGEEGNFCKHCVAVGLAALKAGNGVHRVRPATARPERNFLVSWLSSLSKDELVAEILELCDADPELRSRVELRAASRRADAGRVRDAVWNLVRPGEFIDYDEAWEYASNVRQAATAIGELIEADAAADAMDLASDAVRWIQEALGQADDSSGSIGDAAYELLAVHLRACQAEPPDPVELGYDVAALLLRDSHGLAPNLEEYADLLGDVGMATLRERISTVYAENPDDFRAWHLMETVLAATGDADELIAFLASRLDNHGWQHLRIARELDKAGRPGEALAWAERGTRELADPREDLVEYVADRYAAAGRADDVLALRRARFQARRTLPHYQALRQAATDCGVWESTERADAVRRLRADAAATKVSQWAGPVLVDALVDDGELDAAWTAAADGANQAQWLRLADASAGYRPADALAVYLKAVEALTDQTGNDVYRRIASLLLSARACHEALGTVEEFRRYLAMLRIMQKRKRNLMKILTENGL
jgi:uncharacterized Zn finger protein